MHKYSLIVCGGTFDLLHKGHKSFLREILGQTDHLIIGLTTDAFVSKSKEGNSESYKQRKQNLKKFLESFGKTTEIVPIEDIYGPLLSKEITPDAIAVTQETKHGLDLTNVKRENLGLKALQSIVISMDKAEDGQPISSTRIRNGQINRDGRLYVKKDWEKQTIFLPESLRPNLQKPFGQIVGSVSEDIDGSRVIAVGDITAKLLNEKGVNQHLSIVDYKVHREKKFDNLEQLGFDQNINKIEVKNEASSITPYLLNSIKDALGSKKQNVILVDGEEDLAVIPSLLVAPLGYSIFYGQPNEGLVMVEVTEENKEKAYRFASLFVNN